ncbi:MAG: integrase, partial [Alphaproteobacteria bacterium]
MGRQELVRSLGSVPYREAKAMARALAVWSDEVFRALQNMKKLDDRSAAELARDVFRRGLDHYEDTHLKEAASLRDSSKFLLRDDNWAPAAKAADDLLRREGFAIEKDSDAYSRLCRGLIRASAEIGRITAARRDGDYTARPLDPLFADDNDALRTVSSPKFAEAWPRYVAEKVKAGAWREDMQRENATTSALFLEAAGDSRLDRYRRTQFSDFVGTLQALPALRGKVPQFSGKALSELVAMTQADLTIKTLSPSSVRKHLSNLSSFFGWAIDQGYLETNPAKGVYKLKRTKRRNEERAAWSAGQIHVLFTSPL